MMGSAGGAIAGIGTVMQMVANNQDQGAINKARAAEIAQQATYQSQANGITKASIADAGMPTEAAETAAGAKNRTGLYNNLSTALAPVTAAAPPSGAGGARSSAASNVWGSLVSGNMAKAGSYQDWENQQSIKSAQAGQKLGILGSFSQGTASLLPVQLQVAGQKGDELGAWGNVISNIGNAVSGAAQTANNTPQTGSSSGGSSSGSGWDSLLGQNFDGSGGYSSGDNGISD